MTSTPDVMIEVGELTKLYGDFIAIEGLTFQIRRGEVVGLLGPNGSGKTTTMRILTGYMPPTSGTAKVAGYDVITESFEARRQIGYLPETVPLYLDMEVEEYLSFMGSIRGMEKQRLRHRIDEVIDRVRIGEYRHRHIGKLSKGYRQRVGLAQAILHEPEVLILDEPTIGIDPIQVVETRQLIKELGAEHTVLISTHILPEVSAVCERVLIIHEGLLVAEDTPDNLSHRLRSTDRIQIEIEGPPNEVTTALRGLPDVIDVRRTSTDGPPQYIAEVRNSTEIRERIARMVVERGWGLLQLAPVAMSLEEIFLELTRGEEEAAP